MSHRAVVCLLAVSLLLSLPCAIAVPIVLGPSARHLRSVAADKARGSAQHGHAFTDSNNDDLLRSPSTSNSERSSMMLGQDHGDSADASLRSSQPNSAPLDVVDGAGDDLPVLSKPSRHLLAASKRIKPVNTPAEAKRVFKETTNFIYRNSSFFRGKDVFAEFTARLQQLSDTYPRDTAKPTETRIALFKTHKTASSTLASVLFRFAARQHLHIFAYGFATLIPPPVTHQWAKSVPSKHCHAYDVAFQHLSGAGTLNVHMRSVFNIYASIINQPKVVTILRDPISHALSWACYMRTPQSMAELANVIEHDMPPNTLAADFGLETEAAVNAFAANDFNKFSLVCLSEYFDECLVMMKRKFNWSLLDITYLRLLDSAKSKVRYDGKRLMSTPKLHQLPARAQRILMSKTRLDKQLFQIALDKWKELEASMDPSFFQEVKDFQALSEQLARICDVYSTHPACVWYGLDDLSFYRLIQNGRTEPVPFMLPSSR